MSSTRLWVTEDGSPRDPTVVLVHGSMDRSSSFAKAAARLDGFRVVRYDRRGYGRSIDLGAGSLPEHAADLLDIIGTRSATVIGHSLGGLVALVAATLSPLVVAVGSWEAPMSWADWWPANSAGALALADGDEPGVVAERFMRRMVGDAHWERMPQATRVERRREGAALVADLRSASAGQPFDPEAVRCPVLLGYGSATNERHQRAVTSLAALLDTPPPYVIDGATHGAHRSHASAFADFVRDAAAAASPPPAVRDSRRSPGPAP